MIEQNMWCGRSFGEWKQFATVLEAHDIHFPRQLNERLGRKTQPEPRIDIFDRTNRARLLGSLPRGMMPCTPAMGHCVNFATMPKMCGSHPVSGPVGMNIERVSMEWERVQIDAWTLGFVLLTGAPLAALMKLREFRLPGETDMQANERHFYA